MKVGTLLLIDLTEIKIILREHCEQFYANKLDNLDETEKSLGQTNYQN